MPVLDAVMQTNAAQPQQMLKLLNRRQINPAGSKITILGLAFKPGTDDVRESPALSLLETLANAGSTVTAYDPVATEEAQHALGDIDITYATSLHETIDGADVIMLVTSWPEFAVLPELITPLSPQPLFIDCGRMLSVDSVVNYEDIGRGNQTPVQNTTDQFDKQGDQMSSVA